MEFPSLRDYAAAQLRARLDKLAQEAARASASPDEEAIHDLRVSIRRFTQGLILFAGLLPSGPVKQMRKELKRVMKLTNELRNRDIALEYLGSEGDPHAKELLLRDRAGYAEEFRDLMARFTPAISAGHWRAALEFTQ